ncbi:hypothetical protein SAMN04488498_13717 [Mesorhizobium albiziae]|uniref:Uncharacterized protein n=2 Tax=Neomesorhizobium albiziae TaxID=335020 RepID=A0A1I4F4Y8_9HYPH|nr:hypothetical protein SAMN04488498_13717 [Mesorhizobium albiziae]
MVHRFGNQIPHFAIAAIREEIQRLEELAAALEVICMPFPIPMDQLLARSQPNAPILDQWRYAIRPVTSLVGLSTGHPRLPGDRRSIVTSEIFLISEELGWARSYSRWYRLGQRFDGAAGNC